MASDKRTGRHAHRHSHTKLVDRNSQPLLSEKESHEVLHAQTHTTGQDNLHGGQSKYDFFVSPCALYSTMTLSAALVFNSRRGRGRKSHY